MFFVGVEFLPVLVVLVEVDLVSSPKRCQVLFVHFEDGMVLDGEQDEALRVFCEDGFFNLGCREGGGHAIQIIILSYSECGYFQI